jgi:hypothetical protein
MHCYFDEPLSDCTHYWRSSTPNVKFSVNSAVTHTTHTYNNVGQLEAEAYWAHFYAGFTIGIR